MLKNLFNRINIGIFVFVLFIVACGTGGFIVSLSVNPSSLQPYEKFTISWKVNYDKTYYVNLYLSPTSTLPSDKNNYYILTAETNKKEVSVECTYWGYNDIYNCYSIICETIGQCVPLPKKNGYIVIEACKEKNKNCSTKSASVTLN